MMNSIGFKRKRIHQPGESLGKWYSKTCPVIFVCVLMMLTVSNYDLIVNSVDDDDSVSKSAEDALRQAQKIEMDSYQSSTTMEANENDNVITTATITPHFSHMFSPFTANNSEFEIVFKSWKLASEIAWREHQIKVEFLAAVLDQDLPFVPSKALLGDNVKVIHLEKSVVNYMKLKKRIPLYGEMFQKAQQFGSGKFLMYTNVDIGLFPDFYYKAWSLLTDTSVLSWNVQRGLLQRTKDEIYSTCLKQNGPEQELLCYRDSMIYFEDLGGPHMNLGDGSFKEIQQKIKQFFRATTNSSLLLDQAIASLKERFDGVRIFPAMTITRLQINVNANEIVNKLQRTPRMDEFLQQYQPTVKSHPGNDLFLLQRDRIPQVLLETTLTHLRPAGILIALALREERHFYWRRITSTKANLLSFHLGEGTNEWGTRSEVDPYNVLLEAAHFFTRLNMTKETFFPPYQCQNADFYRESKYCEAFQSRGFCRGYVRLGCSYYYHKRSREAMRYRTLCYRLSVKKQLNAPYLCEFCNVLSDEDGVVEPGEKRTYLCSISKKS